MNTDKNNIYWPGWDIPKDEEGKTWKIQKKSSKIIIDIEKDCWDKVK